MPGTLFVVATPIGNLDDISARALRILGQVALIAAEDTRRTGRLLARYGIKTPTTSLHAHNEKQKTPAIIQRLLEGNDVALVSDAGTPTVSDPGRQLIRDAAAAGLRTEPIPGPSAAIAALSISGFPGDTFTFLGFPPTRSQARSSWLDRLSQTRGSIIFFEAPHRIRRTLEEVRLRVGETDVVVTRELTKMHEELVRRPISNAIEVLGTPRGELTVVLFLGDKTNINRSGPPDDARIADEYAELMERGTVMRREALRELAGRYHLTQRQVYSALERFKKCVE
jgi:16S rRNA (cytidine1402-2'-O)-methyltransferase